MQRNDLTSSGTTAPRRSRRFNRATFHRGIRLAPLLLVAVMLAAAAALFGDQPLHGQTNIITLAKNTGQPPTILFEGNPPDPFKFSAFRIGLGQVFTTGSDAAEYKLDSIGIRFETIDANADPAAELTATLRTVSAFGSSKIINEEVICTLTNPATFTSDAVNFFHATTDCPYLKPSTDYAIALVRAAVSTHEINLYRTGSDDDDQLTTPTGFTIHGEGANQGSTGDWSAPGTALMIEVRGEIIAPQLTSEITAFRVESAGWNSAEAFVTATSTEQVFIRWRPKSETTFGPARFSGEPYSDGTVEILFYGLLTPGVRYVVQASQDESFSNPAQLEFSHDWKNIIRDIKATEVTYTTALVEVTVVPSDQEQRVWVYTGFPDLPRDWQAQVLFIPANASSATTLVENLAMGRRYILDAWDQTPAHRTFFNRFPRESFTTPAPVTLSPESLNIDEGDSETYTVVLDNQPTGNVTISISAGRELTIQPPGVGTGIILAGDALTTQPPSLLFTTTNWDAPQTVTVSAGYDEDPADDTFTITHTVASGSAAEYAALFYLPDVHVTVLDVDVYHQVKTLRTLVANTGSGNNQAQSISTSGMDRWAQGFTTGIAGGGYVLASVGLRFSDTDSNASPGDLEVTLNQVAANGHPGDALCTLNNPASLQQRTVNAFTAPTAGDGRCSALKPNTEYFVVIKRISGTPAIRLTKTSRNGEDSGHPPRGWSIADSSRYAHAGATVWISDVNALKLDIEGDYVPALTATDASAEESGDPNSSTTMTFQIFLDQKVKHSVSVDYATQDGTAEAGVNYKHTSGTVTLAPGEQVKTVEVEILEDDRGGSTYFMLILSNQRRAGLRANSPGTGRIFDASPRFRSWDTSARESNTGRDSTMSFVVEFDHRPHGDTADYTVDYRTEAVTATAGSDYESVRGTLTWAPRDGDKQVDVTIKDDEIQDNGETLRLVLSNPSNGAQLHRTAGTVIGTILNHDSEGLTATFPASAYASKSHKGPTDRPQVVVAFNSAVASISTTTPSAVVNGASITSVQAHTEDGLQNAQIFILEPDGNDDITFTLVADVACASGGICSGTGTPITQVPSAHTIPAKQTATTGQLSVADTAASEEDDSTIDFVVTLNPASDESVTVDYATANASASAGDDYTAKSGSLTFNAGDTTKTIQVSIIDDAVVDNDETLTITLSNASGAEISDGQATGTITDGDTATSPLTAAFQALPSNHDGSAEFTFRVLFSEDVGISYVNMRDDAFTVTDGDVETAKRVDGRHDLWEITVEPDDNSDVVITLPADRACTTAGAICTREDTPRQLTNSPSATVPGPPDQSSSDTTDDTTEEPTVTSQLSVADATASEEDDATIDFVVTLNPAGEASITVDYATSNGTANAGSDYTAQSGTLTFTAGETSQTVTVAIIDDSTEENDETLTLTLSNPSGAEISDGQATGTITDSEPAPLTVSFSNVPDSHDGSTEFTFDLTFSENFPLSYKTLRDHAFTKDAQNEDHVVSAQRKVPGSNQTWTITVEPSGNAAITITLPATTDCTVSGAICTSDGRKLSHSTSVSVAGPS